MPAPRLGLRLLAACSALTLALALSACSDDGDDGEASDTTEEATDTTAAEDGGDEETTTEATEPTSERTEEDATAIVEAINITIDDFADGWEAEEESDDDGSDDTLDDCFTTVDLDEVVFVEEETPQFSALADDGTGQIVNMKTAVFDSVEDAEAVVLEAGSEAFATCAEEGFATSLSGATGDVVAELTPTPDNPALTEESLGLAGAIVGTAGDGTEVDGLVDLHVFRTADVVSFTLVVDLGGVAFEDTLQGLYAEIATRHAANVT